MAIQVGGVREQERDVHVWSSPCPILPTARGQWKTPGGGHPRSLGADFRGAPEEGAFHPTLAFCLHPQVEPSPPRREGKAIEWGATPGGLQVAPLASVLTAFSTGLLLAELGSSQFPSALGFLFLEPIAHQHFGICREPFSQLCHLCYRS